LISSADVLDFYETWHLSSYRQKAIDEIYEHVCADDIASHGISIGPVSVSLMHSLSLLFLNDVFLLFFILALWFIGKMSV